MNTSSLPGLSPLQRRKRSAILDGAKTVFKPGFRPGNDGRRRRGRWRRQTDGLPPLQVEGGALLWSGQRDVRSGGRAACQRSGRANDGAPEVELRELGWSLARSLITLDNLRLYRAIVAEAERLPELGQVFYENGAKVVRAFAAKILLKRFDKSTAALRAATFVQLVLGDAYLELSIGFTVPNVEARFALQIDEAVAAALR